MSEAEHNELQSADETPTGEHSLDESARNVPLPPASFETLVSMLFAQGMAMLGQLPDPATGKSQVNKQYAKHTIDSLDILSEKTKGNLSSEESKMLSEALHALRMMFVNVRS